MSHVRSTRLIPVAVTLGALCFASAAATPVIAQGTNAIHIEITDGPDAGAYDVTTSEPCQAGYFGPTDWAMT